MAFASEAEPPGVTSTCTKRLSIRPSCVAAPPVRRWVAPRRTGSPSCRCRRGPADSCRRRARRSAQRCRKEGRRQIRRRVRHGASRDFPCRCRAASGADWRGPRKLVLQTERQRRLARQCQPRVGASRSACSWWHWRTRQAWRRAAPANSCRAAARSPRHGAQAPASSRCFRHPPGHCSAAHAEDRHDMRGIADEEHAAVPVVVEAQGVGGIDAPPFQFPRLCVPDIGKDGADAGADVVFPKASCSLSPSRSW